MIQLQQERLRARLIRHVCKETNGCWSWLGGIVQSPKGSYGYLEIAGKRESVRRLMYEIFKGELNNATVRNSCGNHMCINPDHLTKGSRKKSMGPPRGRRK